MAIQKIIQIHPYGCGVACLAMVGRIGHEAAEAAFTRAGLHKARGRRQPFSSNFRDVMQAAAYAGVRLRMVRFAGWASVADAAIVKIPHPRGGNWHWVVAERTDNGIAIHDPAIDLPSFENPPLDVLTIDFASYQPAGCMLVLVTADVSGQVGRRR